MDELVYWLVGLGMTVGGFAAGWFGLGTPLGGVLVGLIVFAIFAYHAWGY